MAYNSSQGGVPIVVVGRGAEVMKEVISRLKPEYDAVHTCLEVDTAIDEIPKLLSGKSTPMPSGIGTNMTRKPEEERPVPRAILVGGGISPDEYNRMREAVKAKLGREDPEGVYWLKATREMYPKDLPPGEPPIELIEQVARKILDGKFGT